MSDPEIRELTASEALTLDEEYDMQSAFLNNLWAKIDGLMGEPDLREVAGG
jgi:hypothetical protein